MADFVISAQEVTPCFGDQIRDFLSTANGTAFNICYNIYNIILKADEVQRPQLFELAINLYEDIDSNETVDISISPYESQRKELKEEYGNIVNSFIEFFTNQKSSAEIFYLNLWKSIQNEIFFPSEASKIFAFYYVIIDKRVPYFELDFGYDMSNQTFKTLRKKYVSKLKKVRYILNADFDQKTQEASLLLQELGIPMPENEDNVETIDEYEKKLMVMVEIINKSKTSDFSLSTVLKELQSRLSE